MRNADEPPDVEAPPGPRGAFSQSPAGVPSDGPTRGSKNLRRRECARGVVSGLSEDIQKCDRPPAPAPAPAVAMKGEPKIPPHSYGDMPYEELRDLRKQSGYAKQDANSPLKTSAAGYKSPRQKARVRRNPGRVLAGEEPFPCAIAPISLSGGQRW